ncbi:MAG: hypothetical protein KC438_01905, partial [Thermomicrobiales bacterium]|nr:hypothetical protein [Thermomicrobiales bacterium]
MGRSTPASGNSVAAARTSARADATANRQDEGNIVVKKERNQATFLLPFLLGALVGGFGGAIFGTLMAPYFAAVRSIVGKALR